MQATDRPARVYLTGPMGAGKTTVGRALALRLGWAFLDLDAAVEQAAGCNIAEVFAREGEAGFRRREVEALRHTAERSQTVVATGGGALVQPGAMAWARTHGHVVYLRAPAEALAQRLGAARARPLLLNAGGAPLGEAERLQRIQELLDAREAVYRQADVTVDAAAAVDRVAEQVAEALYRS